MKRNVFANLGVFAPWRERSLSLHRLVSRKGAKPQRLAKLFLNPHNRRW